MKTAVLIASILISGCVSHPVAVEIEIPPKLVVPVVTVSELKCLSDDAYSKLKQQNNLRKARIETLENMLRAVNER